MEPQSPVSYAELHREFLSIETDHPIFEITVDGIPVWERIRKSVFDAVKRNAGYHRGETSSSPPRSHRDVVSRIGAATLRYNPFLCCPRDVLVWGHNRRQRETDGTYWDLYCDPLYDELDLQYLHLEIPHQGAHYKPAKTNELAYLDIVRMLGTVRSKFAGPPSLDPHTERRLERVDEQLRSRFGVDCLLVDRVREAVERRRATKAFYERLVDWHDPSIVIVVVSYGKETFIEVCKERSIPVVELQHGVINDYHYGYSYPGNREKTTFPDLLLTWGEYWNDAVEYPSTTETRSVGYPYGEQRATVATEPTSDTQRVVFLSQPNHVGTRMSEIAREVAAATDVTCFFKLHPEEYAGWRQQYSALDESDVTVVGSDGPSLYELFATATSQVGMYSTAIFEGLQFGLPTFLLEGAGIEAVDMLLQYDGIEAFDTQHQLVSKLERTEQSALQTELFFEPDALANIEAILSRLLA